MRKFSWYTIVHPDLNEGEPPLFRLVGPAILPDEHTCDIYYKPNRKGGHHHRRNYCICSVCGKWFRRNKGRHYDYSDGTYHFCCGPCDEQAQSAADLEADVGGGFCSHYWDDEGDAEWRRKNEKV